MRSLGMMCITVCLDGYHIRFTNIKRNGTLLMDTYDARAFKIRTSNVPIIDGLCKKIDN